MSSKTIRDLETQLALCEQQAEEINTTVASFHRVLEIMRALEDDNEQPIAPAKTLRNAMVTILQEAGEPLHYHVIYDRLTDCGIDVPGKDPRRNVGAHLSNDDRFTSIGNGKWQLTSWGDRPSPTPSVVSLRDRVRATTPPPSTFSWKDPADEQVLNLDDYEPTDEEVGQRYQESSANGNVMF